MTLFDRLVLLVIGVFLIVGVYQFYFWCQRRSLRPSRGLKLSLDDRIPYWSSWVWIYSGLYYPVILYTVWTLRDFRHFIYLTASFLVLLAMQMACFLAFPVETPEHWRPKVPRGPSERFLALVHSFDRRSNCFPSMHVSVAVLTAFHIVPALGPWAWAFPALIALSCLFTKQHYLADLPPGALVGWAAWKAYLWMA